jgi:hypothetical protein
MNCFTALMSWFKKEDYLTERYRCLRQELRNEAELKYGLNV